MPFATPLSLDHLLALCLDGKLIDGFHKDDVHVTISLGDTSHALSHQEAMLFLNGVIKYAPWVHQLEAAIEATGGEA